MRWWAASLCAVLSVCAYAYADTEIDRIAKQYPLLPGLSLHPTCRSTEEAHMAAGCRYHPHARQRHRHTIGHPHLAVVRSGCTTILTSALRARARECMCTREVSWLTCFANFPRADSSLVRVAATQKHWINTRVLSVCAYWWASCWAHSASKHLNQWHGVSAHAHKPPCLRQP